MTFQTPALIARRRWEPPAGNVVATFLLPPQLAFAVAPGAHGYGVTVGPAALVTVAGRSRDDCMRLIADFLAAVARNRTPLAVAALVGRADKPADRDSYHLLWIDHLLIAARCTVEPFMFSPAIPASG